MSLTGSVLSEAEPRWRGNLGSWRTGVRLAYNQGLANRGSEHE